jgi:hypothetical protein
MAVVEIPTAAMPPPICRFHIIQLLSNKKSIGETYRTIEEDGQTFIYDLD